MSLKNAEVKETNRVELEVEVGAEEFEAAVEKAYRKNIKNMNIPGFRKGKAPRRFVEKMYGTGVFYEDAVNALYPTALDAAIKESGYTYIEDKIDLDVVSVGPEGLVFKAVITVKPEIEVGEYKGLKAEKKAEPVTDEDVDAEMTKLQERNSRLVAAEGRPAADGDTVVFDFEGFVDGVAFDGGKGENHTLVLGSGQFIPGFEEQIVGKSAEEEFDVNVTFPEDYHAKELAGKPAVFKCKLHEIKTKELPELNDDFAKDCSEFDTLEELKADSRKKLTESRERSAQEKFEASLIDQLVDGVKGEIPEAMFANRQNQSVQEFGYRLQSQGLSLDMYLQYTGSDMDTFKATFRPQAEREVKLRLALEKIAALEELKASDEALEAEYTAMAEQYKMDVEQVKKFVPAEELAQDLTVRAAMDLVRDTAVAITE